MSAEEARQLVVETRFAFESPILLRQIPCDTERHPARNNRNFVNRIGVGE